MPTLTVSKMSRGLNKALPPFEIEDGQFADLTNLKCGDEVLEVRPGRTRILTQIHASAPVVGLQRFYHGTKETLAFVNGALYSDKTGAWATINGANVIANGAHGEIVVWRGNAWIQDEANNGPYKYDGTTFGAWLNAPKAKYTMLDERGAVGAGSGGRIYAANLSGVEAEKTAFQASDLDNPESWTTTPTTATHGIKMYVSKDDGYPIIGIGRLGSMKLIFKRNGTWRLLGDNKDTWDLQPMAPWGCVAHRTIQTCGDVIVWTDGRRVYSYDGQELNIRFGWDVEPLLKQTTMANWAQRAAIYWNGFYILFFSTTQAVVYDFRSRSWTGPWNLAMRCAAYDVDDDLAYLGGQSVGEVYKLDGATDDGAAITWSAETKHYDFSNAQPPLGDWTKRGRRMRVMAESASGSVTASIISDGGVATVSRTMAFSGSGAKSIDKPFGGPVGLHLGMKVAGPNSSGKVYEMALSANRVRKFRQAS